MDAGPQGKLINWKRVARPIYAVIDLKMQPLIAASAPHGRIPVDAVLNDEGKVCRGPYLQTSGRNERTSGVWAEAKGWTNFKFDEMPTI